MARHITRVVIADDHELVRHGLRNLLTHEQDIAVVGEAVDGIEAIREVERLKPDVILLDVSMPSMGGLDAIRELRRVSPGTRVVVVSMHVDESYVARAFREGALAYVPKQAPAREILDAVQHAAGGTRYLGSSLSQQAIDAYLEKLENQPAEAWEQLTDREREVVHLAATGCTNREIAERLFLSPRTVETHRANAMSKLGVHTHTELVLYAVRLGILAP